MSSDTTNTSNSDPGNQKKEEVGCLFRLFIGGVTLLFWAYLLGTFVFILYLGVARFQYQSIRLSDHSDYGELTNYRWWGYKSETYRVIRSPEEGPNRRWMYETEDGSHIRISERTEFASPFDIRLPWWND